MNDVLDRAAQRLHQAHVILTQLQLLERWQAFGSPVLVGAVAYDLAIAPDIDMEIYCDVPRIEDGFVVLRGLCVASKRAQDQFWQLSG